MLRLKVMGIDDMWLNGSHVCVLTENTLTRAKQETMAKSCILTRIGSQQVGAAVGIPINCLNYK